jgi:hypothetical protein
LKGKKERGKIGKKKDNKKAHRSAEKEREKQIAAPGMTR